MSGLYIYKFKLREESSNDWDRFIGDIMTFCSPNEQSRFIESLLVGVFVWEVSEVV